MFVVILFGLLIAVGGEIFNNSDVILQENHQPLTAVRSRLLFPTDNVRTDSVIVYSNYLVVRNKSNKTSWVIRTKPNIVFTDKNEISPQNRLKRSNNPFHSATNPKYLNQLLSTQTDSLLSKDSHEMLAQSQKFSSNQHEFAPIRSNLNNLYEPITHLMPLKTSLNDISPPFEDLQPPIYEPALFNSEDKSRTLLTQQMFLAHSSLPHDLTLPNHEALPFTHDLGPTSVFDESTRLRDEHSSVGIHKTEPLTSDYIKSDFSRSHEQSDPLPVDVVTVNPKETEPKILSDKIVGSHIQYVKALTDHSKIHHKLFTKKRTGKTINVDLPSEKHNQDQTAVLHDKISTIPLVHDSIYSNPGISLDRSLKKDLASLEFNNQAKVIPESVLRREFSSESQETSSEIINEQLKTPTVGAINTLSELLPPVLEPLFNQGPKFQVEDYLMQFASDKPIGLGTYPNGFGNHKNIKVGNVMGSGYDRLSRPSFDNHDSETSEETALPLPPLPPNPPPPPPVPKPSKVTQPTLPSAPTKVPSVPIPSLPALSPPKFSSRPTSFRPTPPPPPPLNTHRPAIFAPMELPDVEQDDCQPDQTIQINGEPQLGSSLFYDPIMEVAQVKMLGVTPDRLLTWNEQLLQNY